MNAARPGDWVLVAPGDYHERADYSGPYKATDEPMSGVWIGRGKRGLHLRGMDRNRVSWTAPSPARRSARAPPPTRTPGPRAPTASRSGATASRPSRSNAVTVENLTACNFLAVGGEGGNEVWFNGGDGSGKIGMGRFAGRYLSATSTYFEPSPAPGAKYGIFASNASGPGPHRPLLHQQHARLRHLRGRVPRLPHGGAAGPLPVLGARLLRDQLGRPPDRRELRVGPQQGRHLHQQPEQRRRPAPQSGRCPHTTRYCTYFRNNNIHDNNNPNVPTTGVAGLGPIGTGIFVSGGRFDTISRNRIHDNGGWGVLLIPFPDNDEPPPVAHCQGGTPGANGFRCYFDDWGNRVLSNRFSHNGFFGNPTNGDIGDISGQHKPANCWNGNTDPAGVTATPASGHSKCGAAGAGRASPARLAQQVLCATALLGPCPPTPGMTYPQATQVVMPPLRKQKTMPNPCAGVPANPWCRGKRR